ncbi:hypothetical protein ACQKNX_02160 [Lysinibacillus sp. NPDC093712]|uniref:hypothetical protein n=1 Tax=Lysinibacillus sp. NPDC093712 TaxID=3390579 RepID=UPI003CFC6B59
MAKTKKYQPLVVGQHVWIESIERFLRQEKRSIDEHEIIEVNNTSAYAMRLDLIEKYKDGILERKHLAERIKQRTYEVKPSGWGTPYRLWLSKEAFEASVQRQSDTKIARKKAHELVDKMNLSKLKKFLGGELDG